MVSQYVRQSSNDQQSIDTRVNIVERRDGTFIIGNEQRTRRRAEQPRDDDVKTFIFVNTPAAARTNNGRSLSLRVREFLFF